MKLFKVDENTNVLCRTDNTRNGFKHTATLFINGSERESAKICYMNRTWESYQYQSVLDKLKGISQDLKDISFIKEL